MRVREGARLDLLSVTLLILLEFGLELRPNSFPSLTMQNGTERGRGSDEKPRVRAG